MPPALIRGPAGRIMVPTAPHAAPSAALATAPAADPTGAVYYGRQWNMRAIGADAAWGAGRSGRGVTVTMLD